MVISTPSPVPVPTIIQTPQPSSVPENKTTFRHEWYQTNTHVYVTIFAKNIKQDQANIEFKEKTLAVTIKVSDSNEFQLNFELCDKITPEESSTEFLSTKVEVKMKKAVQSRWKTLEDTGEVHKQWDNNNVVPTSQPPVTTQKTGTKNWDKIVKEVSEVEKLDGEESLNKVFQDIYSNGSEEQRRAMMKSFVESGGTVLSTNWDEVGKGEVKGSPPDGLVMHKWNEE